ncbi:MAG: hypothetical protein M3R62_13755 [Acidobacteriota bacterium]|nr:hypothetical protein [Acidobacteriota bacterium]
MISVSQIRFTPAGERRLERAQKLGREGLGRDLPLSELTTDDGRTCRVYLVGPVEEGGPDERLAEYQITIGF